MPVFDLRIGHKSRRHKRNSNALGWIFVYETDVRSFPVWMISISMTENDERWLSKKNVGGGLIKPNWWILLLTIKEAAFGEMYSAMAVFLTVKYPNGSSTYCNCVITLMITVLREKIILRPTSRTWLEGGSIRSLTLIGQNGENEYELVLKHHHY